MRMRSIRHIYFAMMGFILILGLIIIMASVRSTTLINEINTINEQRQKQYSILMNLKNNANLLSRFSRNYILTNNIKWSLLYKQVKAIRDGHLPYPKGYNFDYWAQMSDPNVTVEDIPIPTRPEYPSILKRLREAGTTESQFSFLSQAISRLQERNEIQEAAMDLSRGIKRSARGIEYLTPNPTLARSLLMGPEYIHLNTKFMSAIGVFYDTIQESSSLKLDVLKNEKRNNNSLIFFMAFLLIISVAMTTILLWVRFLKPLDNIRRTIVSKVKEKEFEFKLDVQNQGELKDLAAAQNTVLAEIAEQFESNRQLKTFSDLIRGCIDTQVLGEKTVNFFSQKFGLPYVSLYVLKNDELKLVGGVGVDEQMTSMKASLVSFHRTIIKTREMLRIKNDGETFNLQLPAGSLQLKEIHFIPLKINNDIVGVLELGSIRLLSDKEIDWLLQAQKDLGVGIQLTNNAELQQIAERRISEQLKLNQQIINAIPNPTYFRDTNGRYIGVNDAFTDFLGLFYADVVDKKPNELFPENVSLMFSEKESDLLESPGSKSYDIELTNAQKEIRILTVYEATYFGGNGHPLGIVGLFVDVTTQKKLESDLIAAKDEATEASKAKGEFLANMSHEIRTPMNAILGMSHLALLTELNDKQRNYVSNIEKAGKSLLGIINDILDFSKIEAGKFTIEHIDFRFSDVLDNISNIVSLRAQNKDLELIFDIDPDLPDDLVGDPLRLGQIIINLAGNSLKFTENGEIIIRARKMSEGNEYIEIQFDIEDTGIGMNDEQLSRLFQSFSQADGSITRKYGGTGLGLTISKNFVELMNGRIWVESELNKGSIFSFTIKCGRSKLSMNNEAIRSTILHNKRVLVVDDNQASRDIMYALLKNMDMRVAVVSSGEESIYEIEMADQSNDAFDIIIMDWKMPGINGDEATRKIRSLHLNKKPKVILASAYGEDAGLIMNDEKRLFDASLVKPINPSILFDALVISIGKEELIKINNEKEENKYNIDDTDFTGIRILLVEDNLINQEVAKGILEQYNPSIEIADNGEVALKLLETKTFDIVLMDMQMPVMDGVTASKKIRQNNKFASLPILAMTANAMKQDVEKCKEAGMNAHLSKPIDVNELLCAISYWTTLSSSSVELSVEENIKIQDNKMKTTDMNFDPLVLDSNEGIQRIGGNDEAYWKVISAFIKTKLEIIEKIKIMAIDKNYEEVELFAHSLYGAAGNVSAKNLAQLASSLESKAKSKINIDVDLFDRIKNELLNIKKYIPNINETASNSESDISFVGYTEKEFRIELEQLNILLSHSDTQAVDFISGIKENAVNRNDDLSQIENAIHRFEYEIAAEKLNELLESLSDDVEINTITLF